MSPPLGTPPRNREIVSFRACERRAVLDVGVEWQFKNDACAPFPFPFLPRELFPFPFELISLTQWTLPLSCDFGKNS